MGFSPVARLRLGLCFWGGVLMAASYQLFRHEIRSYPGYYAPNVVSTELRMLPVHGPVLGRPVIGYVSDIPPFPPDPDVRGVAAYYLTQYELVPTLVDREGIHSLAVANLLTSKSTDGLAWNRQWELIQDFGDGVLLVRRQAP